ncbi:uncharacterized protein LOC127095490 [Lathyrus oleraceus]|uniref:uncharacterized protein LOC127095490 n=1 Tax=Pisum sativum TaxID=3888 RepID=UPI0021D1F484|nr:uncharacterized protein LOC127095490 [Pisum sativum]
MAERNDRAIAYALELMGQALQGQQNQDGDMFRGLGNFLRNNPLTFKGRYDLENAQVTEKYFREGMGNKKEIEFLELKQGNSTVTECAAKIYDEDRRARSPHYKSFSGKKGKDQSRGKSYSALDEKGKHKANQKATGGKEQSGEGTPTSGHFSTQCEKSKKAPSGGKKFALSLTETTAFDNLIGGTFFINSIPFNTIIDMVVTHLFISTEYVYGLNLEVFFMSGSMVIHTPTNGPVTTSLE